MPEPFSTGAAILGGSLLGGALSARGASQAASTQADAANRAAEIQAQSAKEAQALQKQMFDLQRAGQEPYRQAGLIGQNRLMTLLGLGGQTDQTGQGRAGDYGFLGAPPTPNGMPTSTFAGGDIKSADYGKYAKDFSMADYQADPGYAFRLNEGMKQLAGAARARGGAVSGNTMMGAQKYAQGLASNEYQNAYNRYQQNRTNQLQPLGNLMASGQSAASNQGQAAGQYGTNVGNLITGAGNAMAGGVTGAGNAMAAGQLGFGNTINNALGTAASSYMNQNNFNDWLRQNQLAIANQSSDPLGSFISQRNL